MSFLAKTVYPDVPAEGPLPVTFPYINVSHVHVQIDGADVGYTWLNASLLQLNASAAGADVTVIRITPTTPLTTFSGGPIGSPVLNLTRLQALYCVEEARDAALTEGALDEFEADIVATVTALIAGLTEGLPTGAMGDVALRTDTYGAKGNGSGDSTAAIQLTIDTVIAAAYGKVILTPGNFVTSATLYLDPPANLRVNLANPSIFSFSCGLEGYSAVGNHEGHGSKLMPTDNSFTALWVGTGQGMGCSHFAIRPSSVTQPPPADIAGVAIAGGSGGSNRTMIDGVEVVFYGSGFRTGYNNGSLGAEVTFNKCFALLCNYGFQIYSTQNYIIDLNQCSTDSCTTAVSVRTNQIVNINGGNFSCSGAPFETLTVAASGSASEVTVTNGPNTINTIQQAFTVSGSPQLSGLEHTYDIFCIKSAHYGLIGLHKVSFNPSTMLLTLMVDPGWVDSGYGQDHILTTTTMATEIAAATTIYAAQTITVFEGLGINADGCHIENPSAVTKLFHDLGLAISANAVQLHNLWFDYNPTHEDTLGFASEALFYCQAVTPFIDMNPGNGSLSAKNWAFVGLGAGFMQHPLVIRGNGARMEFSGMNIYANKQLISPELQLQAGQLAASGETGRRRANRTSGVGLWDVSPFVPRGKLNTYMELWQTDTKGMQPYEGYFNRDGDFPLILPADLAALKTTLGTPGDYRIMEGQRPYRVGTRTALDGSGKLFATSNHFGWTYGQDLTITWNCYGQSNVINMSDTSLMFPGLTLVIPDPAGGTQMLVVRAVQPSPGYVTVVRADGGTASFNINGTKGVLQSGTTIGQQAFSITQY